MASVSNLACVGRLKNQVALIETGKLIGNFPQAFSHIGLVNAAWAISRAGEKRVMKRKSSKRVGSDFLCPA